MWGYLADANPEIDHEEAAYLEIARHVRTALSSKGLYEAPEGVAPEITIEIDFGIDPVGRTVETVVWETEDGYDYHRKTITVHEKFLRITAREAGRTQGESGAREVWSVYVTNEDESDDPEAYALLLVAAAMDAIGDNTAGPLEVVIADSDRRVSFVQRGM
ncbi:MAG: hypothetical protein ACREIA_17650 [Opitutaceae bacterium]